MATKKCIMAHYHNCRALLAHVGDWVPGQKLTELLCNNRFVKLLENRPVMCCETGGVRFFAAFPRKFVTEIKLM